MRPPILITGIPRSGTSLTAELLHRHGAWKGQTKQEDHRTTGNGQPGEYYENKALRQILIEHLRHHDTELKGRRYHPVNLTPRTPTKPRRETHKILTEQGHQGQPWIFKDPKITLCWKTLHEHFPKATWIITNRDLQANLNSLQRTEFMNQYQQRSGWLHLITQWTKNHEALRQHPHTDTHTAHTTELIQDEAQAQKLLEPLPLTYNEQAYHDTIKADAMTSKNR